MLLVLHLRPGMSGGRSGGSGDGRPAQQQAAATAARRPPRYRVPLRAEGEAGMTTSSSKCGSTRASSASLVTNLDALVQAPGPSWCMPRGYVLQEVRDAPDRPGTEFAFVTQRS